MTLAGLSTNLTSRINGNKWDDNTHTQLYFIFIVLIRIHLFKEKSDSARVCKMGEQKRGARAKPLSRDQNLRLANGGRNGSLYVQKKVKVLRKSAERVREAKRDGAQHDDKRATTVTFNVRTIAVDGKHGVGQEDGLYHRRSAGNY